MTSLCSDACPTGFHRFRYAFAPSGLRPQRATHSRDPLQKKTWMRLGLNHGDTNIENNSVETTWFSEKFKIRNFILIFRVAACTT